MIRKTLSAASVFLFLAAPAMALTIEKSVKVGKKTCDVVTWTDAAGKPRSAALVRSDGDGNFKGGYIDQYVYFLGDKKVTARSDETMSGVSGLGCAVNHHAKASTSKSNSTSASTAFILEGASHCIWRFKSQYHGPNKANSGEVAVGLVIDYFIADGRSDVLWAVSYDCSKLKDGEIAWDARGPYFQFDWDGDGKFFGAPISGIRWGDKYKFKTVKYAGNGSTWDYTEKNVIPYMMLYKDAALGDAEAGVVQTLPWTVKDAGGYWWSSKNWGKKGSGMMENWNCPYQLNAYEGYGGEKMAWGNVFGTVGMRNYQGLDFKTNFHGYPCQGYSTLIILNKHSEGLTDAMIASLETVQKTKLTAAKGSVVTSGPAFAGLEQKADYCVPGWDGVYGQWMVQSQSGQAEVNFDTGEGTLLTPTICFAGVTASPKLSLNGKELQAGKDCFVTIDQPGERVLVTLVQPLKGAVNTLTLK